MSEDAKFCTACGRNLEPHMQYCPQCGKPVDGSVVMEAQKEFQAQLSDSRRNFLIFAIAVYAIPAIIMGLIALIDSGYAASAIFGDSNFQKFIIEHHLNITQGDLQNAIIVVAVMQLLSGLCAAGSIYLINKREKRKQATILCAVAAVLCIWSIFGMFIGLLMTWNVWESEDLFTDE